MEAIYRQRYPQFLRVATAMLGDVERGRDAVHETFVRALRSLDAFRGEGSLEAWIWRTHVNVCLVEQRHRHTIALVGDSPTTGEPSEWREVRTAVAALPDRQRTALFLRHYADLDYEQIGVVLGVARGTVAATLHAARATLRQALEGVRR